MAPLLPAALVALAITAPGGPDGWDTELWPLETVELSVEPRVAALFAALNACGLDEGGPARSQPTSRWTYGPARQAVRDRVRAGPAGLLARLEAFLDAHPVPAEGYLLALLGTGPSRALEGLEPLLEEGSAAWRLDELAAGAVAMEREALLAWLSATQGPLRRTLELLRAPGQRVHLVSNLLDAPGAVRVLAGAPGGRLVVVLGPPAGDSVLLLATAVSRALLAPLVERSIGAWTRGPMVLREARMDGAKDRSPAELATTLLSRAVAARALGGAAQGPALPRLEDASSLETWVRQALPLLAWHHPRD